MQVPGPNVYVLDLGVLLPRSSVGERTLVLQWFGPWRALRLRLARASKLPVERVLERKLANALLSQKGKWPFRAIVFRLSGVFKTF